MWGGQGSSWAVEPWRSSSKGSKYSPYLKTRGLLIGSNACVNSPLGYLDIN
jgi:hypothetical protein